jgi:hypothetical protein
LLRHRHNNIRTGEFVGESKKIGLALLGILALSTTPALAVPITYEFSTGPVLGALNVGVIGDPNNQALLDVFANSTVTGSFVYDSESPVTSVVTNPLGTQYLYDGAVTALTGSVAGFTFGDASGRIQVGDELNINGAPRDILQISGAAPDFTGFDLGTLGLTLLNARLFWIEGNPTTNGGTLSDFLSGNGLPSPLPDLTGLFAFSFAATGSTTLASTVTFRELQIRPVAVPEPVTLSLLVSGIVALASFRRRTR